MYDELVKRLRMRAHLFKQINQMENCIMDEAADAIEDLSRLNHEITKRELKARMEKPRWIPVTEALPEEMDQSCGGWSAEIRPSDDVLVWLSPEKRQSVAWYSHTYNEWTTVDENTVYYYEEITHWMPLPPPPEEES